MNRTIGLLIFFSLLVPGLKAQSIRLKEFVSKKDITGDTVVIQATYHPGWAGYESLDMPIIAENISSNTLEISARKIEYDHLQNDVLHSYCFAGMCYDTGTYVSPNHADIFPGSEDSSFLAHYLFDNRVHIRGVNHVAYVFYDVNNTKDSAVVYVTYNTVLSSGLKEEKYKNDLYNEPYPNPANDVVYFQRLPESGSITLTIINLLGETMEISQIPSNKEIISINTKSLPSGLYYFSFYENSNLIKSQKIILSH